MTFHITIIQMKALMEIVVGAKKIVMIVAGVKANGTGVEAVATPAEAIAVVRKVGSAKPVDSVMQKEVQAPSVKEEVTLEEALLLAPDWMAPIKIQSSNAMKRNTMRIKRIRFFLMRLAARVTY